MPTDYLSALAREVIEAVSAARLGQRQDPARMLDLACRLERFALEEPLWPREALAVELTKLARCYDPTCPIDADEAWRVLRAAAVPA